MEELFSDLIKLSLNCLEYFEKNEELSEIDANDILNEFEIVHSFTFIILKIISVY